MTQKLNGKLLKFRKKLFLEDPYSHKLIFFEKDTIGIVINIDTISYGKNSGFDKKLIIFIDNKIFHKNLLYFKEFKIENYKEYFKLL